MASLVLSDTEKHFVLDGVSQDFRTDGRGRRHVRPIVVETGLVSHASGSAHLRLANTDVLVGVKAELEDDESGAGGRLEFSVDCSANATPEFEGRGGDDLAARIARALDGAYASQANEVAKQLSVSPGGHCWTLRVDILILECGGNLFDAVSMAVKAALLSTIVPAVKATVADGDGRPELELSDDPFDGQRLSIDPPVLVTLCRLGSHCVVDPTPEEEACSAARLVVGVRRDGTITTVRKMGAGGCFGVETLEEALEAAKDVGKDINGALEQKLRHIEEEEKGMDEVEKVAFLE